MEKTPIDKLSDSQLSSILYQLEEQYPELSRLPDYKLIGLNTLPKHSRKPRQGVWIKIWHDNNKYSRKTLQKLRGERGVGRPPKNLIIKQIMKEEGVTRKEAEKMMSSYIKELDKSSESV